MLEVKTSFLSCVRRFLFPGSQEEPEVTNPKHDRSAAAWWLTALDHALFQTCKYGLEAFATAETPFPAGTPKRVLQEVWLQRCLFLPLDHCSVSQTGVFACRYKFRLAVEGYLLLLTTTYYYLLLLTTTYYYLLLLTITYYYLLLLVTTYY